LRQSIRGYTDGLIALAARPTAASGQPGWVNLATVTSDVAAVRAVLAGSDDLSRALSDPGIPLAARRGVLHDLFDNRIDAGTLRVLDFVLGADRASETVADLEWLSERLEAASKRMEPVGDIVLGTKAAEERLEGYATAQLETVEGGPALATIEEELFRFSQAVAGSEPLRQALTDREIPAPIRRQVVADLLGGKAGAVTVALAVYATQVGRPRDFETFIGLLIDRVAAESNRRLADVRSAVELDDRQRQALAAALGRAVGREVEVRVTVDPSVVAGFVATIGDTVVDGSARHQLELLKERLVSPEVRI
jgi:F-type H+-transporting ATPase subunit delta